jgi:hypothetical protein
MLSILRKDEAAALQQRPFCAGSLRSLERWLFHLLHEIGAYTRSFYLTTHKKCDHNNCASAQHAIKMKNPLFDEGATCWDSEAFIICFRQPDPSVLAHR